MFDGRARDKTTWVGEEKVGKWTGQDWREENSGGEREEKGSERERDGKYYATFYFTE